MRNFAILGVVLVCGVLLLRAQIFNLEEEDDIELTRAPAEQKRGAKVPLKTIVVPAVDLPEDASDTASLNKVYDQITSALKANNVAAATKLMSSQDVITKQKLVLRLMKENPRDYEPQQKPTSGDAAFGDVPEPSPAVQDLDSNEE